MKKFPRAFFITLRETPSRESYVVQQLREQGIDAEKYYGVNGIKLGLKPASPDYIDSPHYEFYLTRGAVGCYLSHFSLWNMLLHYPDEEFLIFEDDLLFCSNFKEQFEQRYKKLPDWDIVYVGWVPIGKSKNEKEIVNNIFTDRGVNGTHAYMVKKSALPILIEHSQPIITSLDISIRVNVLPKLKWFVFDPSLINQLSVGNNNDPTWLSTVYDWEIDGWWIKSGLFEKFGLGYGWYDVEHYEKSKWRWTSKKFSIHVPPGTVSILIECTSPIPNTLKTETVHKIYPGKNLLEIHLNGKIKICAELQDSFIPFEKDPACTDSRKLGISVEGLKLKFEGQEIPFGINQVPFFDE